MGNSKTTQNPVDASKVFYLCERFATSESLIDLLIRHAMSDGDSDFAAAAAEAIEIRCIFENKSHR